MQLFDQQIICSETNQSINHNNNLFQQFILVYILYIKLDSQLWSSTHDVVTLEPIRRPYSQQNNSKMKVVIMEFTKIKTTLCNKNMHVCHCSYTQ